MITEADRIKRNGILSESFFVEETRCDFFVTKKRKHIWAVELDLLLEFDRVCKKHKLSYYLSVGTLLGAIRHNGFIPWDDDVDVEMLRQDYEKLYLLKDEFTYPYFLQTPYTDPWYAYSHIRLRNIRTTCFPEIFAFQPMCHGMYIDIFPLDRWDKKDNDSNERIDKLNRENSTYMRLLNPFLQEADRERVANYSKRDHLEIYEEIQSIAKKYQFFDTNYLVRAVRSIYPYNEHLLDVDYYKTSLQRSFEGHYFPIPSGYEEILKIQFGEYKSFPPYEKRGYWHKGIIFEPDIPYEEYLEEYKKLRKNELFKVSN